MKQQIMDQLKAQKGHVGFYYKNLVTGQQIAYQEEEAFLAASVIKLPIFKMCIRDSSNSAHYLL